MAFGISKEQVLEWKEAIERGEIAFLTHYWIDDRFPASKSVTKAGCKDMRKLSKWGAQYGLKKEWIHHRKDGYSHFDLLGQKQEEILKKEGMEHILKLFS